MNNNEYLSQYIKFFTQTHDNTMAVIFDSELIIKYISSKALSLVELTPTSIGMKVRDLNIPHAIYSDELLLISKTIIETRTSSKYILAWIKDSKVFLREHYASPIINDQNNEVVGMFVDISIFEPCETMDGYFNILNKKLNTNFIKPCDNFDKQKIELTPREYEVLFLLVLGKSQKEIANILSTIYKKELKPNSVASMISKQIYPKFEIFNLANLIEKAIHLNMIDSFPQSLMRSIGILNVEFEDKIANDYYRKLKN